MPKEKLPAKVDNHSVRLFVTACGSRKRALFFSKWLEHNKNATEAYIDLHPNVSKPVASVLGSKMLRKINIPAVLEAYGLGLDKYLIQLKDGLEANKQISGIVIGGKLKEADGKTHDFIEVPDHAVRKGYHDKLGKLLGIEKADGSTVSIDNKKGGAIQIIFKRSEE